MSYRLLAGSYSDAIALLSFTPAEGGGKAKLEQVTASPTPTGPSWVTQGKGKAFYTVSEVVGRDTGDVLSLTLDDGDKLSVTAKQDAQGGPCHIHLLKDGSAIVVSNYVGGTVLLVPLQPDGSLTPASESTLLRLPFAYKDTQAPNPGRQDTAHAHHAIEAADGTIYVADLGSDRVYALARDGRKLEVRDWFQCAPGFGPRHVVLSPDEKLIYVLGELSHDITAFPTSGTRDTPSLFSAHLLPDTVPDKYQEGVDGAEIQLHPTDARTLYCSNRLELHTKDLHPSLPALPGQRGDTVAVVRLSPDARSVERVSFVRTGCDCIRGMQVSPDGKYIAVAGMCSNNVEVYAIGGADKTEWTLAAEISSKKVTDFCWL